MSFYQGLVAKLIPQFNRPPCWAVVGLENVDTNCDQNMHLSFGHDVFERAAFVPVSVIADFEPNVTKMVTRTFDYDHGIEIWKALK